jgi:DNA-binding transcriptional MerR regulator
MTDENLTIKQVAKCTGLTVYTLRYYERIGLIQPITRAENSHRRYGQTDIDWIRLLLKLRATGMSIQDMQTYAVLQRQGDSTLPQRIAMLQALQKKVEAHIQELQENLGLITYKIGRYQHVVDDKSAQKA